MGLILIFHLQYCMAELDRIVVYEAYIVFLVINDYYVLFLLIFIIFFLQKDHARALRMTTRQTLMEVWRYLFSYAIQISVYKVKCKMGSR